MGCQTRSLLGATHHYSVFELIEGNNKVVCIDLKCMGLFKNLPEGGKLIGDLQFKFDLFNLIF